MPRSPLLLALPVLAASAAHDAASPAQRSLSLRGLPSQRQRQDPSVQVAPAQSQFPQPQYAQPPYPQPQYQQPQYTQQQYLQPQYTQPQYPQPQYPQPQYMQPQYMQPQYSQFYQAAWPAQLPRQQPEAGSPFQPLGQQPAYYLPTQRQQAPWQPALFYGMGQPQQQLQLQQQQQQQSQPPQPLESQPREQPQAQAQAQLGQVQPAVYQEAQPAGHQEAGEFHEPALNVDHQPNQWLKFVAPDQRREAERRAAARGNASSGNASSAGAGAAEEAAADSPVALLKQRRKRTYAERHPASAYVMHFVPSTRTHCVQGSKEYLAVALARLRTSPLNFLYESANLTDGPCVTHTNFVEGPDYHRCFPQASVYHWAAKSKTGLNLRQLMLPSLLGETRDRLDAAESEWRRWALNRSEAELRRAEDQTEALCDNGRMMLETFGGVSFAAATYHVKPLDGGYCVQGAKDYISAVLDKLRASPRFVRAEMAEGACSLQGLAAGPVEVPCLDHGSAYLVSADVDLKTQVKSEQEGLEAAERDLAPLCGLGAASPSALAQASLERQLAEEEERRIEAEIDAAVERTAWWYITDESLYSCWQGTEGRLDEIRDFVRSSGMPDWFIGESRFYMRVGDCSSICEKNGWETRKSCVKHVHQCMSTDIDRAEKNATGGYKIPFLAYVTNTTTETIRSMISKLDLAQTCEPGGSPVFKSAARNKAP